ncbi:alpha/beta hydrolase [Prauserella sp. ASG 168]|uniref:Alpha/beta hydrolase n=1 Tax=Prauserella cavernicola TaxID=2800127 RepID=A0A934QYQ5_9PSEU|nr:alpha/beta hydrolase [Prauserella cavernicola]
MGHAEGALTPPPFDPELAVALEELREELSKRSPDADLAARRAENAERDLTDEQLRRDGHFEIEDVSVPRSDGSRLGLLVCRTDSGATGVIYFVHGGGMIVGDNRSPDVAFALGWAAQLGLAVVSVDYRLAPEHPHPAPVEDCYAGLLWTAEEFAPGPIVLAGVSAGGGLAAATALLARDRGGPTLAAQVLLCPMLDDRNDSVSARQMTGLGIWDSAANEQGWSALLGDQRGTAEVSPYAAPARAEDLSGLPPTFLDVGSAETFRDEVVDYATRLWQAGGQAELHVWPGAFHGFDLLAPDAAISAAARAARVPWLRRVLGR